MIVHHQTGSVSKAKNCLDSFFMLARVWYYNTYHPGNVFLTLRSQTINAGGTVR